MTNPTRELLIKLSSHMAYMQGHLEARHESDDPEDYYWYRESVALRQKVIDALAEASVTGEPSDEEGPSAEEVEELCEEHCFNVEGYESIECLQGLINEAIARWGRPAIKPVPVSERLPEAEDCDAEGECYWFDPAGAGAWYLDTYQGNYTHWLPHHALPVPTTRREEN